MGDCQHGSDIRSEVMYQVRRLGVSFQHMSLRCLLLNCLHLAMSFGKPDLWGLRLLALTTHAVFENHDGPMEI